MKNAFFKTCFAVLCLLWVSSSFAQSVQDFKIENRTGVTIYDLYVAYAGETDWGEDLLGENVLNDGEDFLINFAGYSDSQCSFDVMIGDTEGNYFELFDVDLCSVTTLTFTEDNRVIQEEAEEVEEEQIKHLCLD